MATSLIEKLPGLTDDALASLFSNAQRLGESGTRAQKDAATQLIPAIEQETATRQSAKAEAAAKAKAARPSAKKKAKPKIVKEAAEAAAE